MHWTPLPGAEQRQRLPSHRLPLSPSEPNLPWPSDRGCSSLHTSTVRLSTVHTHTHTHTQTGAERVESASQRDALSPISPQRLHCPPRWLCAVRRTAWLRVCCRCQQQQRQQQEERHRAAREGRATERRQSRARLDRGAGPHGHLNGRSGGSRSRGSGHRRRRCQCSSPRAVTLLLESHRLCCLCAVAWEEPDGDSGLGAARNRRPCAPLAARDEAEGAVVQVERLGAVHYSLTALVVESQRSAASEANPSSDRVGAAGASRSRRRDAEAERPRALPVTGHATSGIVSLRGAPRQPPHGPPVWFSHLRPALMMPLWRRRERGGRPSTRNLRPLAVCLLTARNRSVETREWLLSGVESAMRLTPVVWPSIRRPAHLRRPRQAQRLRSPDRADRSGFGLDQTDRCHQPNALD